MSNTCLFILVTKPIKISLKKKKNKQTPSKPDGDFFPTPSLSMPIWKLINHLKKPEKKSIS